MNHSKLAIVIACLSCCAPAPARAAVETYDLDPVHTWVGFTVSHFFTKVPGFFAKVKGVAVVDREHLEKSTAEGTIEVASITTNTAKRDDDLRSSNFFAAEKFPVMTFKSKSWKSTGGETYDVNGTISIKGVEKEVVFKVTSLGFGPGMKGAMISGWDATIKLDRRDFGISADQGLVGNSVDVLIHIEADLRVATPAKP
jgi:polyisoprenoid-binding protein YceI